MSSGRESSREGYSRDRSGNRDSYEGKVKCEERERSSSRYSDDSEYGLPDFVPEKYHHERAKTKNMRKEISHWYVPKDAPQAERKWSLNQRAGKYPNDPRDLEDREKTSKGNRAAVRDLDRYCVAHKDFAYKDSSPGFSRSDQRYANDDAECREPASYRRGPDYIWVPASGKSERRTPEERVEHSRRRY